MENWKSAFLLRDDITFLNFGSFGACPKPIFERYQAYQLELENEPVAFIAHKSTQYLQAARSALGSFLNCDANDVVCIMNPSYGVNIIARSLNLQAGDEILTTNLEYGACNKTWEFIASKTGAIYKKQAISLPIASKEELIEAIVSGINPNTKLLFISHITSSTGLRLPVEEICAIAKEKGILTLVDGAHGPAQVDINLQTLQADFYVGACHKWMMGPKGTSFLYAAKNVQHLLEPLIVSWGYGNPQFQISPFIDYHEVQGTRDLSAFCTLPFVVDFLRQNDWETISSECRKMVQTNAKRFCELLEQVPLSPIQDEFIAQMYSIKINTRSPTSLHDELLEKYKIQIPISQLDNQYFIRYSINAFNSQNDLDQLYDALTILKSEGKV